jgi:hypothetical protein
MIKKQLYTCGLLLGIMLGLVACTTDQVLADINLLIGIAGAIIPALGQVSPADAALAAKFSQIAQDGMAVVKLNYDAVKSSGAATDLQKFRAAANAVQTNLDQELAAAHIVDPVKRQRIAAWVNLFDVSLNAILAAMPTPTASGKLSVKLQAPILSPAAIKTIWRVNVCHQDAACAALVK